MAFSIKQVAAMLGISPQTLRFYERYGIHAGQREGEGGYRSYSHAGVDELMSIRKYRNCGFTLAQAARALKCGGPDSLSVMLAERASALKKQVALQSQVARHMETLSARIRGRAGACAPVEMPALVCVPILDKNRRAGEQDLALLAKWARWMPMAQWTAFFAPDFENYYYGYTIEKETADALGIAAGDGALVRGARRYLPACVSWQAEKEGMAPAALAALKAMRDAHGAPDGEALVQTLCNCFSGSQMISYGQILYPLP